MAAEKVMFQPNQRHELVLRFPAGKIVSSNFDGQQMMFSLADGRVMYLPLEVGERIQQLNLSQGEPFSIGRMVQQFGQTKSIAWDVRRVYAPGQFEGAPPDPQKSSAPPVVTMPRNGLQQTNATTSAQNGHGNHNPRTQGIETMLNCGRAAVLILREIDTAAKEAGLKAEDVRALMTTLYISATQNGVQL